MTTRRSLSAVDTDPVEFVALPSQARTMIRLRALMPTGLVALVLVVGAVAAFIAGAVLWGAMLSAIAALLVAAAWIFSGMVFGSYRWRLTSGTVELQRGVIVRRHEVLPRARVQNVTKHAGPIARMLGVATVTVHSAGAATPNVSIPDLIVADGDAVRASLLPQA